MTTTKTLIKLFTAIINSSNKQNAIENFIYHRLNYYLDMMKTNQDNRGFIKYLMHDLLDYAPEARDFNLNFNAIENNQIWMQIKNAITK